MVRLVCERGDGWTGPRREPARLECGSPWKNNAPGTKVVRYETDWAAVAAQAQGVIAPQQAATFETVLAGKKLQQQMTALSSAIRAASNAKPGGG
ncbi:MAG: hypothetical protein EXS35_19075 [Pedosphaera sp.]|nr:hypothetical protein [Pedosphaera sp.]